MTRVPGPFLLSEVAELLPTKPKVREALVSFCQTVRSPAPLERSSSMLKVPLPALGVTSTPWVPRKAPALTVMLKLPGVLKRMTPMY